MDTDKNGVISLNEFIAATLNTNITKDYKRVKDAFRFFNVDNDGFIDEYSLKFIFIQKKQDDIDISNFKDVIKEWDFDNDGKINLAEFLQIMDLTPDQIE